ncbi:YhgE/Pip family protein [Pseudogracilibacillus sp. SE30717A]|uniref:YhgE/Pip domain-containing protein n=1 Tax=Pseudogracilibacillus sp. SE30717A TaxID=3098293 RepID=UPI00300E2809
MFKKELSHLFKNKLVVAGLIIALFIPTLYSATFLWSFWDPYENMESMKVAIVNEDEPVTFQGNELTLGKEIEKNLRENETFTWDFVTKEKALEGLNDNTYSMMIFIPSDFSEKASTVFDKDPKQPVIEYVPNQSKNYMFSMIEESMVQQLRSNIADSMVESYMQFFASNFEKISEGVQQLNNSVGSLADGIEKINEPIEQTIHSNPNVSETEKVELISAITAITEGSSNLSSELEASTQELSNVQFNEANLEIAASPLKLDTLPYTKVSNYGNGFTPFTLSLGLFIGAMVITMVFPAVQTFTKPNSFLGWFGSKYIVVITAAILQAVIADVVLLNILGIEVGNTVNFVFFTILVSIVFAITLHCLSVLFKDAGRLLMVVLLILQITSSGGTFPTEMVPSILQKVSSFLPMTYSISGFRSLIGSENMVIMWENIRYLMVFLSIAFIGSISYFASRFKSLKNSDVDEYSILSK